jgi:tRNA-(ms[2]io[6]A)-hydroxylase
MNNSLFDELIKPVKAFLYCETPKAWLNNAVGNEALLLVDHAHCEKKAASTGLNLIYRYPEKTDLLQMLSQLVREEMLHFEQVIEIIEKRGYRFDHLKASSYAASLIQFVKKNDPERLVDNLIIGAIIEARSCERFYALANYVDDELAQYYRYLLKSECRHFEDYLHLAKQYAREDISERLRFFLEKEKELILAEDAMYRFHSGIPVSTAVSV